MEMTSLRRIALCQRPVRARPHRVHARQAADVARDDAAGREQEAGQRDDAAVRGLRRVVRIAPQRIVVADAVRVVPDVVAGRLVAPRLLRGADLDADALAQVVQALLGDLRETRARLSARAGALRSACASPRCHQCEGDSCDGASARRRGRPARGRAAPCGAPCRPASWAARRRRRRAADTRAH